MTPLVEFGLIVGGLFVAGWASRKAGQSPIIGYILLGILFGPYGVVQVYRTSETTELLGELGIVLLLFFMGLEFSIGRFRAAGAATLWAGTADLVNFGVGFGLGLAFGLGWLAALFLGGIMYISSSGVIAKLLTERDLVAYPEAERTLGVLVFEDLAMIVILGGLGMVTAGGGWQDFVGVALFAAAYLLLLRYGRGLLERLLARDGEALALLALALVVLFSMGALELGFPEAVAAFLLGMLVAETQRRDRVFDALHPWHDVAAAAFFFEVGLHVEIASAIRHLPLVAVLVVATIVTNLATGFVGGRWSGLSRRASIGHGLMLLPRGEFSLVIASLAGGVAALSPEVRETIVGATSLYVVAMVVLGSVVYARYDALTERIAGWLRTPEQREREASRQRDLDSMRLD